MFDGVVEVLSENLGFWYIILINIIGVLAILTKASEYQFKKRAIRFMLCITACTCWLTYFLLQGQTVSTFANLVSALQTVIFMQRDKHEWAKSKIWLFVFLILQISTCVIGFRVWHDIFPPVAGIFGAIAYFVLDEKKYRCFALLNVIFWLSNSISKMPLTLLALICDSTCTISGTIGLVRFYKRQKGKNAEEEQKLEA